MDVGSNWTTYLITSNCLASGRLDVINISYTFIRGDHPIGIPTIKFLDSRYLNPCHNFQFGVFQVTCTGWYRCRFQPSLQFGLEHISRNQLSSHYPRNWVGCCVAWCHDGWFYIRCVGSRVLLGSILCYESGTLLVIIMTMGSGNLLFGCFLSREANDPISMNSSHIHIYPYE